MAFGGGSGNEPVGDVANRPVLDSFTEYSDAQDAVDKLSDQRFPVEHVAIVGVDLRLVESVLGRTSYARAAMSTGATFAWLGAFIGIFVSFFGGQDSSALEYVVLGVLFGAGFGIVFGLVSFAVAGRRREFLSRQDIRAGRYDLVCDPELMARARRILGRPAVWPPPLPQAETPAKSEPESEPESERRQAPTADTESGK